MIGRRYVYCWGPRWGLGFNRKGETCTVLARGSMNSALVKFEDGKVEVISRNALRRLPETNKPEDLF